MLFTSPLFLLFFLAVLACFYVLRRIDDGRANSSASVGPLLPQLHLSRVYLLFVSLVFYASWEYPKGLYFLPLLLGSSVVDWMLGNTMYRVPRSMSARRRGLLIASLIINLGSLSIFKYLGFFASIANDLAALATSEWHIAAPKLILPLGISFFTFQSMSYTIDAFRRRGRPYRSLLDFLFFVTFFPQLIAGPIVRAEQFRVELIKRRDSGLAALAEGAKIATVGLVLKVVLGDNVAIRVDRLWAELASLTPGDAIVAYYGFGLQIFCDFAGYSLIAIGLARCFGFRLPRNFDMPYLAVGLRDFWRRWHITLSTWLRDYLYIPLGGSRHGVSRTAIALALTMLLGGLWHGASWNFVIWGGAHGLLLALGRITRAYLPRVAVWQEANAIGRTITWLVTLHVVFLLWIPFRAQTLGDTLTMLSLLSEASSAVAHSMQSGLSGALHHESMLILPFLALFVGYHAVAAIGWRFTPRFLLRRDSDEWPVDQTHVHFIRHVLPEDAVLRLRPVVAGVILGVLWAVISVFHVGEVSFIYFAF